MTDPVMPSVGTQLLDPSIGEPPRSVAEAFGDHYRRALAGDAARLQGGAVGVVGRTPGRDQVAERGVNVLKHRTETSVARTDRDRGERTLDGDGSTDRVESTRSGRNPRTEGGGSSSQRADPTDEPEAHPRETEVVGAAEPKGDEAATVDSEDATRIQVAGVVVQVTDTAVNGAPAIDTVDGTQGEANSIDELGGVAAPVAEATGVPVAEAVVVAPVKVADGDLPVATATDVPESDGPEVGLVAPTETVVTDQAVVVESGVVAVGPPGSSREVPGEGVSATGSGGSSTGTPDTPGPEMAGATVSEPTSVPTSSPADPSMVTAAETVTAAAGTPPTGSPGPASVGPTATGSASGTVQTVGGGEGGVSTAGPGGPGPVSTGAVGRPTGPEAGSLQRVVESIEAMSRQHPPRSVTLDFGAMHGLRVRLAVHATGVQVTVTDAGAGANRVEMWERQLSDLLGERGLGSGQQGQTPGGWERESSRPWIRPGEGQLSPVRRARGPRTDEIRL